MNRLSPVIHIYNYNHDNGAWFYDYVRQMLRSVNLYEWKFYAEYISKL
jgi:hypothetical protein